MTELFRTRVGSKGQVVIAKELREKYGIKPGAIVQQLPADRGVLLAPVSSEALLKELDEVAESIGRKWPSGVSAVKAIKEDREKRW